MKKHWLLPFLVLFIGCQPGKSDFIDAIEQYYIKSNGAVGGGNFSVDYIEIIEIDRKNKCVLAKAVGNYSNASIANGPQNEPEEHVLWYFYEEGKMRLKIKAIRTPEQLKKHLD
jgi:hypothetical protein